LHHLILRDLGYEFESIILDGSKESFKVVEEIVRRANSCGLARAVRIFAHAFRFAYLKGKALENLIDRTRWLRARETDRGSADRLLEKGTQMIDKAESSSCLKRTNKQLMEEADAIPFRAGLEPLRVMLVGEVYIVLEPLLNFGIEKKLGNMGVEVHSYISEHRWFIHPFRLGRKGRHGENHAQRLATPYLKYNVGGEDKNTVGFYLMAKQRGFDGVIHFKPFTCMPEIVAKTVLYRVAEEEGLPFISFTVDEHSGGEGFATRLEAFIDMLSARKSAKCMAI
jgi:predicted nucleotide-binding protein (sugar kinase/HSP70/actin superfamily)